MTQSLEGWLTKAKEAPSPHEVRLALLDTNPVLGIIPCSPVFGFSNFLCGLEESKDLGALISWGLGYRHSKMQKISANNFLGGFGATIMDLLITLKY